MAEQIKVRVGDRVQAWKAVMYKDYWTTGTVLELRTEFGQVTAKIEDEETGKVDYYEVSDDHIENRFAVLPKLGETPKKKQKIWVAIAAGSILSDEHLGGKAGWLSAKVVDWVDGAEMGTVDYDGTADREGVSFQDISFTDPTKPQPSNKYPDWKKMDRKAQNAILKEHGYRWVKLDREWLEDNDDFWTRPGWHLYAPDGREVDVAQAFDKINRGVEVVLAEIETRKQTEAQKRQQRQLIKNHISEVADLIRQNGERPEEAAFPKGEKLFDTFNIYGGGEMFVIELDQTVWYIKNNGMDGDNWSWNNLPGCIGWRWADQPEIATELRQLSAQRAEVG